MVVLVASLLIASASLLAAQAKADYDTSKQLKVEATVTRFVLTDMHAQIDFDARDEKGAVQHWSCEADNVNTDYRFIYGNDQGWDRLTFQVGDMVTITFNPSKKGTKGTGLLLRAELAGDNVVFRVKK
jgi:uncharacterized protein YndB with AHSA1/START domain